MNSKYDLGINIQNDHAESYELVSKTEKHEETFFQKLRNKMIPSDQSEESKLR